MSKKKTAGILVSVAVLGAAIIAVLYFLILKSPGEDNYEKAREGMKAWENVSVPGISLYIPEDYERSQNDYYTSYIKGNASVSLTSEEVENDLANYAYYAVRKYEDITDSFKINEEYDEQLGSTSVHVVEFDYGLNLDSGIRLFSCLSAYVMGDGRSYVLTCVTDAEEFAYYRDDFHRIYKTMVLTSSENEK